MKRIILLAVSFLLLGQSCAIKQMFPYFFNKESAEGGLFYSNNKGESWKRIAQVEGAKRTQYISKTDIRQIVFDRKNSEHIYLVTKGAGVFESLNRGESFKLLVNNDVMYLFYDTSKLLLASGNKIISFSPKDNIYKIIYAHGVPGSMIMSITRSQKNKLVAITSTGEILISSNNGETWSQALDANKLLDGLYSYGSTIFAYSSTGGMWRSSDNVEKWEQVGTLARIRAISSSNKAIYIADEANLMYSLDRGSSWAEIPLITKGEPIKIWSIAVSTDDRIIYYATQNAFYVSRDKGSTWKSKPLPAAKKPIILLAAPDNKGLFLGFHSLE